MRKKAYYLSTCNTCKRILSEIDSSSMELQEIKSNPLTLEQVEELRELAGSYEALLNRRAKKYQERGLKEVTLSEEAIKALLLEHYTFLKRPVFVIDNQIFIGNSKKVVASLKEAI